VEASFHVHVYIQFTYIRISVISFLAFIEFFYLIPVEIQFVNNKFSSHSMTGRIVKEEVLNLGN